MKNEDRILEILSESLRNQDRQYDLMIGMNKRFQETSMENDKKFESLLQEVKTNQVLIKNNQEKNDKRFGLLAKAIQNLSK